MTLTVYKIFLKLYEFHKNQCLIYKYYSHHPLIYVGEKKNPLPKFMLLNRLWLNPQSCDMKLSFFLLLFVFIVSSRSAGVRGKIAVSGRRRPSATPPTLTAVWKSSLTRTALLYQHTASRWVCLSSPQSPPCHANQGRPCLWATAKCSRARPHVVSCNISLIQKISSARDAEVGRRSTINPMWRLCHPIFGFIIPKIDKVRGRGWRHQGHLQIKFPQNLN